MKTKNLEDKIHIGQAELQSSKSGIEMEYYLIHDEEANTYGVEIIKNSSIENPAEYEFESFANISTDCSSVKILIKKLSQNYVTPIELRYVLEDLKIL